MEVWTTSHITTMSELRRLKQAIESTKHILSKLTDSFIHRVSISYDAIMTVNVSMFISKCSCVVYKQRADYLSQSEHLRYIQRRVNKLDVDPETMIVFLNDSDLLMSYPRTWDSYDVIVGYQEQPVMYVTPFMKLFALSRDFDNSQCCALELMVAIQETYGVVVVINAIEKNLMITQTVNGFSGYSSRLRVINDVFEDREVHNKHIAKSLMNALNKHKNKLDYIDRGGIVYHRFVFDDAISL